MLNIEETAGFSLNNSHVGSVLYRAVIVDLILFVWKKNNY